MLFVLQWSPLIGFIFGSYHLSLLTERVNKAKSPKEIKNTYIFIEISTTVYIIDNHKNNVYGYLIKKMFNK